MEPLGCWLRLSRVQMPTGLRKLALECDGVVTIAAALECGLTRSSVYRRVKAGEWRSHGNGVYTVADHPETVRTRLRVETLVLGDTAVLSGLSAAYWHGLADQEPKIITVTVPPGKNVLAVRKSVRLRYRDLEDADVITRGGLPVTGVPLSVLEGAVEGGAEVVDNALLLHRVSIAQLHTAAGRRRGRSGHPEMVRLLEGVGDGARSAAERVLATLLRRARIRGWVANHPTAGYFVDVAFPEKMLAVEIDGMASHGGARAFQRDRTRRNALIAAGWTVLNFTWADLIERPTYVTTSIHQSLTTPSDPRLRVL